MSGVNDLYQAASDYLAACEQAVASAPGGPIARSFVSPGVPAIDCAPQLAVYVGGPIEADTRPLSPPLVLGRRAEPGGAGAVHLVNLTCVVARCVDTLTDDGSFPSASALEANAVDTIGDVWAIWNVVRALYRAGLIFTRPDGERRELYFDGAIPLVTSGGAGGFQIPVRVQIDGYAPVVVAP